MRDAEKGRLSDPSGNGNVHISNTTATLTASIDASAEKAPPVVKSYLAGGLLRVSTSILRYETSRGPQFIDITDDIVRVVAATGITNGIVTVYSRHTTAAIKINEHEPELIKDMEEFLLRVAPEDREYYHNDFIVRYVNMQEDESPNGHSHCQHLLLSTSETIPIINGFLQVGRWQRVFLLELDRARTREVAIQTMGC